MRDKAEKSAIWIEYNNKDNVPTIACVTTVGCEGMKKRGTRRKYVEFYDLITQRVLTVPAHCKPEILSVERVRFYKGKLMCEVRERIEEEEKETERAARKKGSD